MSRFLVEGDDATSGLHHRPVSGVDPGELNKVPVSSHLLIERDVASQRKQDGGGQNPRILALGEGSDK